jgi:integrase
MKGLKSIVVRPRKDGTLGYRQAWLDPDTREWESRTFESMPAAEKFRAQLVVNDLRAPKEESAYAGITLSEFAPVVIGLSRGSARYKKDNLRDFETHIEPHLGKVPVADIGYGQLAAWQDKLLASGCKAKSITTYRSSILGPIFNRAMQKGPNNEPPLRTDNPLKNTPHPREDDPYRAEILTKQHVHIFFAAAYAVNPAIAELLLFMLATGWRWSEAGALQVRAIEFEDMVVKMERVWAVDENNQRYIKEVGKTKLSTDREVPVPQVIVDILRRLSEGRKWGQFIFVNPSGVAWPRTTFQNNWERILDLAKQHGFPDIALVPHGLRHSYLTALGKKHIGQTALQTLAGHADPRMSAHYMRNLDPHTSEAVRSATDDLVANVIPIRRSA